MSSIEQIRAAQIVEMQAQDRRSFNQVEAELHLANLSRKRKRKGRAGGVMTRLLVLDLLPRNREDA